MDRKHKNLGILTALIAAGMLFTTKIIDQNIKAANYGLVKVEKYKVSKKGKLSSGPLSSCSVVCFYDENNKIGALGHYPIGFTNKTWKNYMGANLILENMVLKGAEEENIESISFRSLGTTYPLKMLQDSRIPNRDAEEHYGLDNIEFDIDKGEIKVYDFDSIKTYEF